MGWLGEHCSLLSVPSGVSFHAWSSEHVPVGEDECDVGIGLCGAQELDVDGVNYGIVVCVPWGY